MLACVIGGSHVQQARSKDPAPKIRPDRYFLFTYGAGLGGVKVSMMAEVLD
jgi:hypothetical protein